SNKNRNCGKNRSSRNHICTPALSATAPYSSHTSVSLAGCRRHGDCQIRAMSALGHKRTFSETCAMSAIPPKADITVTPCHVCFGPKADIASFDDLIGDLLKMHRYVETERLGSFEVDHQLELGRLLDRQIGGFFTFQNSVDICRGAVPNVVEIRPIRH